MAVTFEDSPREDARAEELPLLTWGDEEGTEEPSDWSRPEARPEEEDLKCPPAHDPLIQEFLSGEVPWAGDWMEDNPQQILMPEQVGGWCLICWPSFRVVTVGGGIPSRATYGRPFCPDLLVWIPSWGGSVSPDDYLDEADSLGFFPQGWQQSCWPCQWRVLDVMDGQSWHLSHTRPSL